MTYELPSPYARSIARNQKTINNILSLLEFFDKHDVLPFVYIVSISQERNSRNCGKENGDLFVFGNKPTKRKSELSLSKSYGEFYYLFSFSCKPNV